MRAAGKFDDRTLPAAQRFDVGQMFADRGLVALPLIQFVPLVVIVKDERDEQHTREWVAKGKTVEDLLKEFGRI